jgi:hypothetical protein
MAARPHPDLISQFKTEMRQAVRRDQAAMGHAASEAGLFRSEQGVTHNRMNSVRSDEGVG